MMLWTLMLVVVTATVRQSVADSNFTCDSLSSNSHCSCSKHSFTFYELLCPQLSVQINLQESVQLQCISDSSGLTTLSGLEIGDVERFVLRLCLLPEISIRELMARIGIKRTKMLQIQSYNNLADSLQKKHFEKLDEVTNLSLNNNGLTSLPRDIFEDMGNLTWLDMKMNSIVDFPKEIFYFTPKLEVLELGKNGLTHLKPGIFKNLDHLRLLNLWGNRLANLTKGVFSDLRNLESLDLNSNKMETIRPDLFADLLKLKRLNLYANAFISLPQGLLSRNLELTEFQMQENQRSLVTLPPGFLSNLTELRIVRLSNSMLMSLPEDTFWGSKNIQELHLESNSLKSLAGNTFIDLEKLEMLDISHNLLSHLPKDLFSKIKKLKTLKMDQNQLTEIPPALFLQQKNLEFLDLRFNKIKVLREQFYGLESLKTLNISDNQLEILEQEAQFKDPYIGVYSSLNKCKNLEDLQLANNSLSQIYGDWKFLLTRLHTLNLSYNRIQSVEIDELDFFSELFMDLSNNEIDFVDFRNAQFVAFNHVNSFNSSYDRDLSVKRKTIKFDNNPFNCDCRLLKFVQFIKNGLSPEVQFLFKIPGNNLKCFKPLALEKKSLSHLPLGLLTCDFPDSFACPKSCKCKFRSLDTGGIIDCQNKSLQQIPLSLPVHIATNHSELHLEGNQLHTFKIPENSSGYENVTYFYLSNNNIASFNTSGISKKIKVLDLSNNNLTMLSTEDISFLEQASDLEKLDLHGNQWQCNCETKPLIRLLKGRFKEVKSSDQVTCPNGIPLVKLEESELCPESARLIVALASAAVIFCLLLVTFTILYFRYRTEIQIYCFSSKWKILRWMVSHPDIDVDKKYDAFISYSNEDEKFVTEKLVPYLEENGETKFKLCLHYRDWIPGESIPNQILHSVQNSRRTIVVLSPRFLESVWGKVEFRTAHCEALKDGTARVIVLLYEDVGPVDELEEELKVYFKMNTYVKWDSPWFWQQLNYALPHPPEDANDINCIFACFQRAKEDSNSHEVLQNVQVKDGEVHFLDDVSEKPNGKDSELSPAEKLKTSQFIIDPIDTKHKKYSHGNYENGNALVGV